MSWSPLGQVTMTLLMFVTIVLTSKNDCLLLQIMEMQETTSEYHEINRQQQIRQF